MSVTGLRHELIEAVIDAYMYDNDCREGGCSEGEFIWRNAFSAYELHVSYPGGTWSNPFPLEGVMELLPGYKNEFPIPFDAANLYANVESAVTSALEPWTMLPEEGGFASQSTLLESVTKSLSPGGEVKLRGDGPSTELEVGNAELDLYVKTVEHDLDGLGGEAMQKLRDYFAWRIRPTMSGQSALAAIARTAVAGEAEIWKQAHKDVENLVEGAIRAFRAKAEGNPMDWAEAIKVTGSVLSVLGMVIPGLSPINTILGVVGNVVPTPPEEREFQIKGGTAEAMWGSFQDALGDLGTAISETERSFADCATTALATANSDPAMFNIRNPSDFLAAGESGVYGHGAGAPAAEIRVDDSLKRVAARFELIGDLQRDMARRVVDAQESGPWTRPGAITTRTTGHYTEYDMVISDLTDLLIDSSKEMHAVAEKCILLLSDFRATDSQVEKTLDRQSDQIEREVQEYGQP